MPRKKKDTAASGNSPNGAGHNSGAPLDADDEAALYAYFGLKIRGQQKRAAEAKAKYDLERDEVNALFSSARGELRITRKEFEEVLASQDMGEAEYLHAEAQRTNRHRLAGLPVGEQLSLALGDTADEQQMAFNDGERAGFRGDDPAPPETVSPILVPKWMEGWHQGAGTLKAWSAKAEAILAARAKPDEPEVEAEPEPDFDPDGAALKLKRSAFMDRGGGDDFEDDQAAAA